MNQTEEKQKRLAAEFGMDAIVEGACQHKNGSYIGEGGIRVCETCGKALSLPVKKS